MGVDDFLLDKWLQWAVTLPVGLVVVAVIFGLCVGGGWKVYSRNDISRTERNVTIGVLAVVALGSLVATPFAYLKARAYCESLTESVAYTRPLPWNPDDILERIRDSSKDPLRAMEIDRCKAAHLWE